MKKRALFILFNLLILVGIQTVIAQPIPSLFQPLTWEQASSLAARENKLVLVEVGSVGARVEKGVQSHRELINYLLRNVVAIRMDMNTPQGKGFESRLLLNPYPAYAFFMPYGDLVGIATPEAVGQKPESLREILQQAQEVAREKKSNSRTIAFADMGLPEALAAADKAAKKVFIAVVDSHKQPSLLMDRNVFNLDRVADFYNQNFVSLRLDAAQAAELVGKYQLKEAPAYLYLTSNGKLLFQAEGYCPAEQLIGYGNKALEKAKGIAFRNLTDEQARNEASQSGKLIFTDYYTPGSVHKELLRTVFADPEVTDLFTEHFINVGREGDSTLLIFSDARGNELHRVMRVENADDLLNEAKRVMAGKGLAGMQQEYGQGNRQAAFMQEYVVMLYRADRKEDASRVAMEYLATLSPECLKEKKQWDFFNRYVISASPAFFEYVMGNRNELFGLYGEEQVRRKISALWISGAENFVNNGQFDEAEFKEYTKRLKKEKVEGWRIIVRNARMHAAEKVGDWKTYINLAEEKWNEEQISDAELYRWAVRIDENCHDENIRYKTAQWLAQKVIEMERREQITGKVNLTSYKGFFEKLVNDLLKK